MDYVTLHSLPVLLFAHAFGTEQYHNCLCRKSGLIEISYVEEGELQVTRDRVRTVCRPGDIICNLYRADLVIEAAAYHRHHTVCFAVDFSADAEPAEGALPLSLLIRFSKNTAHCRQWIDEIIRVKTVSPQSRLKCAGLFMQLLNELGDECNRNQHAFTPGEYRYIQKAKQYIYENIGRPIRQKELAAYLGITPEYLCAVFKKGTGESVMRFINRSKLESIRSLMEKEHIPLYRAAELYGFADANYVSRLYKRYFDANITDAVDADTPQQP